MPLRVPILLLITQLWLKNNESHTNISSLSPPLTVSQGQTLSSLPVQASGSGTTLPRPVEGSIQQCRGAGSSQFLVIQTQGMLTQQGSSAEPPLCTRHSWKPLPHEEMGAPTGPFILQLQDGDQVPSFHEWDMGPWDLPPPAHLAV